MGNKGPTLQYSQCLMFAHLGLIKKSCLLYYQIVERFVYKLFIVRTLGFQKIMMKNK